MLKQLTSRGVQLLLVQRNSIRLAQALDVNQFVQVQHVSIPYHT